MSKLRLFLLTGFLAAAVAPLYGCGSECGPGTVEQDGQCVLVAEGCGQGTILSDKKCLVDTTGCSDGTTLSEAGQCIPSQDSCADGTTFDQALRVCVPNTEIVCGESTTANDDGTCVPDADACSDKTVLDEDTGRCIVEAAACGAGTELNPTTGKCDLSDLACGSGTAIDANGQCAPTEDLCDAGTAFDEDSGLCLSDSCQEGDAFVDGICMNPAEELAHNADATSAENDDPALGGTANPVTLNAAGEDAVVFAGAIDAPTDLDADGIADQDVDVFEFDATAGQWVEVMVQSTGLPAPAFKVEGPGGYERYSRIGGTGDVARQVVTPAAGTYTVTVLPTLVLDSDGQAAPSGDDSWGYVGTLNVVDAPTPTDSDISGGTADMSGELVDLSDNFFNITGVTDADTLEFTVNGLGEDARGILQVWSDATTLHSSQPIVSNGSALAGVPPTGDAFVLVDWMSIDGPDAGFDISAEISGNQTITTVADGATETLTISADVFDRVVVTQSNPSGSALDVVLKDPNGDAIAGRRIAVNEEFATLSFSSGDFTAELTNNSGSAADVQLMGYVSPPTDLGAIPADGETTSAPTTTVGGTSAYYSLSAEAGEVLAFEHANSQGSDVSMVLYSQSGDIVGAYGGVAETSSSNFYASDYNWTRLDSATTLLVEVQSGNTRTEATLIVDSITPMDEGDLSLTTPISTTVTDTSPENRSMFHVFNIPGTQLGYSGTLTSSDGNDLDVNVYDAQGNEVASDFASSGVASFGSVSENGGSYLVEVECDEPCNGYDLDLQAYPVVEELGTPTSNDVHWSTPVPVLGNDQTVTVNFTVPAGHILEVGHRNDNDSSADLFLYDSNGTEIDSETYAYPFNYSYGGPDLFHHYVEADADFSVVLRGTYGGEPNAQVMIRLIQPHDVGTLSQASNSTHTDSTSLMEDQWYVHQFSVPANSAYLGLVSPLATGQDIGIELNDTDLNYIDSWFGTDEPIGFGGTVVDATTFWMVTECSDVCDGVEFDAGLVQLDDPVGNLTADQTTTHTIGDLAEAQPRHLSFNVPAGQMVEISHFNNEEEDHNFRVVDANGDTVESDSFFYPTNDASAEYMYFYSENGGDYTLELEGGALTTGQTVSFRLFTPANIGQVQAGGSPVTADVTEQCVDGQSYIRLVDFAEGMSFDGLLSPKAGEDLDFYLHDLSMDQVASETGTGGDVTIPETSLRFGGTYIVRIDCDEDATGFDLTLENGVSITEDLGAITADTTSSTTASPYNDDQLKVLTFSVDAGQMIEIFHSNTEEDDHDFELFDANGDSVASDSYFYPTTYSSPDFLYWYAQSGGSYSLVIEGRATVTDQVFSVRSYTPNPLGSLALSDTASITGPQLIDDQSDFHMVTFSETGDLRITGSAGNTEDLDVAVYDETMTEIFSDTASGGVAVFRPDVAAGPYLVEFIANEDMPSYTAEVALLTPHAAPDFSAQPALAIPNDESSDLSTTLNVTGCATITSVEAYVDITHSQGDDLTITLTAPDGTTSVLLKEYTSISSEDFVPTWYPYMEPAVGDLTDFDGLSGNGDWTLTIFDEYDWISYPSSTEGDDEGTLEEWGLTLTCQ